MGNFSDRIRKQLNSKDKHKNKNNIPNEIEFACGNCLNVFTFVYEDMCFNKSDDLQFTPEPECPRCGATQELVFSDFGQEKIEDMILGNQIKKCK